MLVLYQTEPACFLRYHYNQNFTYRDKEQHIKTINGNTYHFIPRKHNIRAKRRNADCIRKN